MGCSGEEELPENCIDTWETYGQNHILTWCTSCHSAELVGPVARYAAPEGIDFDTLQEVRDQVDRIEARATGDAPTMPPAGGVDVDSVQRFEDWLKCGLPGDEDLPMVEYCVGEPDVRSGGATITGSDFCGDALHVVVDGDVTFDGEVTALDCLCEVGGDAVVAATASSVSVPSLHTVGGTFEVQAGSSLSTLRLPALAYVGSDVALSGVAGLSDLDLDALGTVEGNATFSDLSALPALGLARLLHVGGDLSISDSACATVDLARLADVGGSISLVSMPDLQVLAGDGSAVQSIGGSLTVADNPKFMGFYGFTFVTEIGGDVVIENNADIFEVNGFTILDTIGGTLRIAGNGRLNRVDGFDNIVEIRGGIELINNASLVKEEAFGGFSFVLDPADPDNERLGTMNGPLVVADNPMLGLMEGVSNIRTLTGLYFERNGSMLEIRGFPFLNVIAGDLVVADQSSMNVFDALPFLQAIQGDMEFVRNPALPFISGLGQLELVTGNLTMSDNPSLPQAGIDIFLQDVTVNGTVTTENNAF